MKQTTLALIIGLFTFATVNAQKLPVPSPLEKKEQLVGITKINLEYSRPSVKGRPIFGTLVPYDKVWRLGANACTKLKTSTDIMFGKKTLPKGKYALLATPSENGNWIIIINSDTTLGGTPGYDKTKDVIRVNAKAMVNSFTETLSIGFDNIKLSSAVISIEWEKLRVDVPFTINTEKYAKELIEKAVKKGKDLEKVYSRAATFHYSTKDYKKALMAADKALKVKPTGSAFFTKARSLKALGKTDKAIKFGKEALVLIQKTGNKGFAAFIEKNIKEWSK